MTIEEAIIKFISGYAGKKDWIMLDALNQWAVGIPDHDIRENLKVRYPEVRAFSKKYNSLLDELATELKKIGIEYPSYQSEDLGESIGSFIQHEIDSQCGEYYRQDIKRRIQEAKDSERKLLYLYAKYPRAGGEKSIISDDLSPSVWNGLFQASFGPILDGSAIDVLRWFNVCSSCLRGKKGYWRYCVPEYANKIIENIEGFVETPEITDVKAYVTSLVSEGNIPRLALLEVILSQIGDGYWVHDWNIKDSFELLYPAMFEKYSHSMVGVIAKLENVLYFCPFNKEKMLRGILEAKKNMIAPLLTIFNRVRDKVGRGDIVFQDKLAAHGGFINLGGRVTVYLVLTPWIAPPQSRGSKDALQQLPWIRNNRTPCVILTTDRFNPDLMRAIQDEGLQDICLVSVEEDMNSLNTYLFGDKRGPFDELMEVLQGLGYQVIDMTKSLREVWYPLTENAVVEFSHRKFGWQELRDMVSSRGISLPSSEQNKEGRIRALIKADGLEKFAKQIEYPSVTYKDTLIKKTSTREERQAVTVELAATEGEILVSAQPVPPKPSGVPPVLPSPLPPIVSPKDSIVIGEDKVGKQWGLIGKSDKASVLFDLNAPHVVFVCGKMGYGKGYTIGALSEMLIADPIPGLCDVTKKATIIVLYKPRENVPSEFYSITQPNDVASEVSQLRAEYQVEPRQLVAPDRFKVFIDPAVYQRARKKFEREYNTENVIPLYVDPSSLTGDEWGIVLCAGERTEQQYVKRLFAILEKLQFETFDLQRVRMEVRSDARLNNQQKNLAEARLDILSNYIGKGHEQDFVRNLALGGVNIFDFRQTIRTPDDVFSVMTLIISVLQTKEGLENEPFVFVLNEAHDYFKGGVAADFVDSIERLIRRKRHGANWLLLDTHFPDDVDDAVIKLADVKVMHYMDKMVNSPLLRRGFGAEVEKFSQLNVGQAFIMADKTSLGLSKVVKVNIRPRITKHGAPTKLAAD